MAAGICCVRDAGEIAGGLFMAAGLAALACAVIVAGQLSRRLSKTGEASLGLGFLLFLAVMGFYGVCAFGGCVAAISLA